MSHFQRNRLALVEFRKKAAAFAQTTAQMDRMNRSLTAASLCMKVFPDIESSKISSLNQMCSFAPNLITGHGHAETQNCSPSVFVSLKHHRLAMIVPVLEWSAEALPASCCSKEMPLGVLVFTLEEIVDFPNQGNPSGSFHDTIFSLDHDGMSS